MKYAEVAAIYSGSDGAATTALYDKLEALGPRGLVAMNLFRAMKCSVMAKLYRGGNGYGSYRSQAYQRKQWSIDNLCRALVNFPETLDLPWGWGRDEQTVGFENVVYVDLPVGQVSYHAERRSDGPDYAGRWDGAKGAGAPRVCRWASLVLFASSAVQAVVFPDGNVMTFGADMRPIPELCGVAMMKTLISAGFAGQVITGKALKSSPTMEAAE